MTPRNSTQRFSTTNSHAAKWDSYSYNVTNYIRLQKRQCGILSISTHIVGHKNMAENFSITLANFN